jgi:hypothetical protein
MKIALLGTGFGQAHAAVYAQRPDLDEVIVFGRTMEKLATIRTTEHTSNGERSLELSGTSPYDAMIDHVLACLTGDAENLIEPASALPALELTLQVHEQLNQLQH